MLTMASRGLSLTTRIFGSTAAVVATVLGVTLFFTSRQAARTADATVNRALAQASSQIASQLDARRRELQGQSETFAKDPDFRALVQSNARPGDLLDQVIEAQERIDADWALELAGMYAPESTVNGLEIIPGPAHGVAVSTEQYELTLGIKYFYDAAH